MILTKFSSPIIFKKISRYSSYLLLIILVIAAILRLNHITQPFTDFASWREASTAMMADNYYRRNWNIFYPEVSWNGPGETYQGREFQTVTYLAALIYVVIGQHDWIGRGVAVAFGVWGVFALYQLVRRVWDEDHALASAAIMAVLPGSIFIERSFLPDPAMVSLVVTSFWFLVAYCQTDRFYYLILATAIGSWGFLTKLPGLIIGIPMLAAMFTILGKKKVPIRRYITVFVAAFVGLVPVVAYYLWVRHLAETYPPYHFAGGGNWLWDDGLREWLAQRYYWYELHWHFDQWIWTKPILLLVGIGLFIAVPLRVNQLKENSLKAPWVFHWWMVGAGIYYFIGAKQLVINSWNFHFINPAAALAGSAIVFIFSQIQRLLRTPTAIATILAIFLFIGGVGQKQLKTMYFPSGSGNGTQSYKLGLALKAVSQPGDLVLTIANDIGEPVAIYYSKRRGWNFPPPWDWEGVVWWGDEVPGEDSELIELFDRLRDLGADWFGIVEQHRDSLWENKPKFMKYIEQSCELEPESSDWVIYRIVNT